MNRAVIPFQALSKGPYFTIIRLSSDTNIQSFRQRVISLLSRYFDQEIKLNYIWIRLSDGIYFAVSGPRAVVDTLACYIDQIPSIFRGEFYLGRGAVEFERLVSDLFARRTYVMGCKSYGGSR